MQHFLFLSVWLYIVPLLYMVVCTWLLGNQASVTEMPHFHHPTQPSWGWGWSKFLSPGLILTPSHRKYLEIEWTTFWSGLRAGYSICSMCHPLTWQPASSWHSDVQVTLLLFHASTKVLPYFELLHPLPPFTLYWLYLVELISRTSSPTYHNFFSSKCLLLFPS